MRECAIRCEELNTSCPCEDCRLWINHDEDLNCTLHAVRNNHTGELTLREVADRMGISFVRVKQIQDKAVDNLGGVEFVKELRKLSEQNIMDELFYFF